MKNIRISNILVFGCFTFASTRNTGFWSGFFAACAMFELATILARTPAVDKLLRIFIRVEGRIRWVGYNIGYRFGYRIGAGKPAPSVGGVTLPDPSEYFMSNTSHDDGWYRVYDGNGMKIAGPFTQAQAAEWLKRFLNGEAVQYNLRADG